VLCALCAVRVRASDVQCPMHSVVPGLAQAQENAADKPVNGHNGP
jgi:hypothetical protein